MTFDERVAALAPLGFTPRQTRFLVTAALHSGYCLRRQYLAFAGVRYGKNVCDFLEALVRRQLAHRFQYQPNRGHVYHLYAKALYRALAQPENRNRRQVSPAVIARKVMVLDAVLTLPEAEWYATEEDKVALFTRQRGIPLRETRPRFATAQMEALYGAWLAHGERALDNGNGRAPDMPAPAAQLVLRELPSTYSQFGSFPGVC